MYGRDDTTSVEDLRWWQRIAPGLPWHFAKTFAHNAPHSYVSLRRTRGVFDRADYLRAARVISTWGQPAKYHGRIRIYMTDPAEQVRWWTLDEPLSATDLINVGDHRVHFGVQDMPRSGNLSVDPGDWPEGSELGWWDSVGAVWDEWYPYRADDPHQSMLLKVLNRFGAESPRTLNIGANTGPLMHTGRVAAAHHRSVGPSQAMFNRMFRKFKHAKDIEVVPLEEVRHEWSPGQYQLVAMLEGAAAHLAQGYVEEQLAKRPTGGPAVVVSYYANPGRVPPGVPVHEPGAAVRRHVNLIEVGDFLMGVAWS